MQVYWAYIVGMLTSLGKMKLDRIHSMLKMFAVQSTGEKECSQVRSHNQNQQYNTLKQSGHFVEAQQGGD